MTAKHVVATVGFGALGWLTGVGIGYLLLIYAPDLLDPFDH